MASEGYGQRLGDIQVAYDALNTSALNGGCISTAATLEDGFNKYIKAGTRWISVSKTTIVASPTFSLSGGKPPYCWTRRKRIWREC